MINRKCGLFAQEVLVPKFRITGIFGHPLGSIFLACSSLRNTRFIHAARLGSPSILACSSNWARKSSANRIWYWGDLVSFGVDMVRTLKHNDRNGNYHCTYKRTYKTTKLDSAGTLIELLTNI